MEKNKRGKLNALDLVELLIAVVLTWLGEKLLDSLWKNVLGTFHKTFIEENPSNTVDKALFKILERIAIREACLLGCTEKRARQLYQNWIRKKAHPIEDLSLVDRVTFDLLRLS